MPTNTMDLETKAHFDNVSYGRLILVFKCRLASNLSHPQLTVERDLAFIEELWPYTPAHNDTDCARRAVRLPAIVQDQPETYILRNPCLKNTW